MFVFKALNGLAPPYLSELLTVREHGRALRSSNQLLLEVPRSKFKHWGDRAFSIAAPRLWNKLPCNLRTISDLGLFKSRLKTYLFRMAFNTHSVVTLFIILFFSFFALCYDCMLYFCMFYPVKHFGSTRGGCKGLYK